MYCVTVSLDGLGNLVFTPTTDTLQTCAGYVIQEAQTVRDTVTLSQIFNVADTATLAQFFGFGMTTTVTIYLAAWATAQIIKSIRG